MFVVEVRENISLRRSEIEGAAPTERNYNELGIYKHAAPSGARSRIDTLQLARLGQGRPSGLANVVGALS